MAFRIRKGEPRASNECFSLEAYHLYLKKQNVVHLKRRKTPSILSHAGTAQVRKIPQTLDFIKRTQINKT